MRRIIIVLNDLNQGGAETQALLLANGLVQRGMQVKIFCFGRPGGMAWQRFKDAGFQVLFSNFREKLLLPPFTSLAARLRYARYSWRLIRMISALKPDVILPFTYPPNIIMARLWQYTGAKACWWNQRDEGRWFLGRPWEIKALQQVSCIVSNSLEGKLFIEKFTNQPIHIIHNGVVLPKTQAMPDVVTDGLVRVVMIANLHSYKDHLTLLRAWKFVVEQCRYGTVELILAGREGSTAPTIRNFITEHHLEDSVRLPGSVYDVPALLGKCQIGVFSSTTEGLPNGILECMAMGLPVVATRMNGAEEALGMDYRWLSKAGDADDLAGHILHFIKDHFLRLETGNKNRERIAKEFDPLKMCNKYIELFSK